MRDHYGQDFPEELQNPDSDPKFSFSGPNWVKIRSKSGLNQVLGEGFRGGRVQRGRSGWEGSVAPRKVLTLWDVIGSVHSHIMSVHRAIY